MVQEIDSSSGKSEIERRRFPRVLLTHEQFRLKDNGKIYPVVDLSEEGVALRLIDSEDGILFTVGRSVEGILNLEREKVPVRGTVRFQKAHMVGIEFHAVEELKKILNPEQLGKAFHRMPTPPEGFVEWYSGHFGSYLLIEGDPIERCTFLFLSQFCEWTAGDGWRTGTTRPSGDASEVRGVLTMDPTDFARDSKANADKIQIAKKILLGSNLSEATKKKVLELFYGS